MRISTNSTRPSGHTPQIRSEDQRNQEILVPNLGRDGVGPQLLSEFSV